MTLKEKKSKIRVVELFAGVGGFRIGLENASKSTFDTIWANQWEPGRLSQHAFDCYVKNFGKNHNCVNEDIANVKDQIPAHDLLVGGFPCQDYSVARTGAKGIEGKKGALWWHIADIVNTKRPKYILLENVDRLLKSPAKQRGRDFGIILRTLTDCGYTIEWRVINAAEYGCAQRRRRTFIFAFRNNTNNSRYKKILNTSKLDILTQTGFFSSAFPVETNNISENQIEICSLSKNRFKSIYDISDKFTMNFGNTGVCIDGRCYTMDTVPLYEEPKTLNDICEKDNVDDRFFLNGNLDKWIYLKGAKREERKRPNGEIYYYTEGKMSFPDNMNLPGRTMLTSESSLNRSTHVVVDYKTQKLRLLTPLECERLNNFPDNWTNTGMPEKFRYFVMGNALVVKLIERMGKEILNINQDSNNKNLTGSCMDTKVLVETI